MRYGADPREVRVGKYHGVIFTSALASSASETSRSGKRPRLVPVPELIVRLPAGHGEMRDLAVSATGLSRAMLIKVVARGLSS
jgi:hypothetical protein